MSQNLTYVNFVDVGNHSVLTQLTGASFRVNSVGGQLKGPMRSKTGEYTHLSCPAREKIWRKKNMEYSDSFNINQKHLQFF
jgi:hypothetical protein